MTATFAHVVLKIPQLDPLVDPVTISLNYQNDGAVETDLVNNVPHLFNTVGAGAGSALNTYMANTCDLGTDHCTIDVYDITAHLNGTPHGAPVASGVWTLGDAASAASLPAGCAAAVSYRASYGADVEFAPGARPRARDRGRCYLGPLSINTLASVGAGVRAKFASSFVQDCLANFKQIEVITGTGIGPDQWNLVVWSRKNASCKPVFEWFMDDRPDYQRRRSDQPGTSSFILA